ncbi:uncharacterized protein LOC134237779 [Saccostrea cucullata]|uniref:uncharacterized protein LOC134237779 n=1 Tax=Saccostrea cuccullata TaxID=36930 RepID=UPI002ECFE610
MLKANLDKSSQELKHTFDQIWKEEKERAGKVPDNQIIIRNILEQVNEWNATLSIQFVDFEKAFDSVYIDSLWVIMKKNGIPIKLITMAKALNYNFQCSVIDDNETTDPFPVMTGAKQGCWMSGFLLLRATDRQRK